MAWSDSGDRMRIALLPALRRAVRRRAGLPRCRTLESFGAAACAPSQPGCPRAADLKFVLVRNGATIMFFDTDWDAERATLDESPRVTR